MEALNEYQASSFEAVWPDLVKFRHFGKMLRFFVYFDWVFGTLLNLLW